MIPVTVRAPCHQRGITELLHFAVVTLVIGLRGNRENRVTLHHLLVGMASLADLRVKFFSELGDFRLIAFQDRDLV
jgi:hypothetical protein